MNVQLHPSPKQKSLCQQLSDLWVFMATPQRQPGSASTLSLPRVTCGASEAVQRQDRLVMAAALNPKNPEAWAKLGNLLASGARSTPSVVIHGIEYDSIGCLSKAASLSPTSVDCWVKLGEALFKNRSVKSATIELRAGAADPANAAVEMTIDQCFFMALHLHHPSCSPVACLPMPLMNRIEENSTTTAQQDASKSAEEKDELTRQVRHWLSEITRPLQRLVLYPEIEGGVDSSARICLPPSAEYRSCRSGFFGAASLHRVPTTPAFILIHGNCPPTDRVGNQQRLLDEPCSPLTGTAKGFPRTCTFHSASGDPATDNVTPASLTFVCP